MGRLDAGQRGAADGAITVSPQLGFWSVGTAEATRIEADFTGTDCQLATFTGRVVLTKD